MNNQPQPQSSIRYEAAQMQRVHKTIRRSPEYQAEVIARHYTSHAVIAINLRRLIEVRRQAGDMEGLDDAIQYCVEQIKRNHRLDFGIELEWR